MAIIITRMHYKLTNLLVAVLNFKRKKFYTAVLLCQKILYLESIHGTVFHVHAVSNNVRYYMIIKCQKFCNRSRYMAVLRISKVL